LRTAAPGWRDLVWLDLHLFRNRVRAILRNPRRLLPWLLVLVFLVPSLIERMNMAGGGDEAMGGGFRWALAVAAPYLPAAGLVALGFMVWQPGGSAPAAFASRADGAFLIGLGMRPRVVLLWLMLRATRRMLLAAVLYILVLLVLVPRLGMTPPQAVGLVLGIALFVAIVLGGRIAAFTFRVHWAWARIDLVGLALAVGGALAIVLGILGRGLVAEVARSVAGNVPPGSWTVMAVRGQWPALVPLALVAAAVVLAGVGLAGDILPEVWSASTQAFERRVRMRQGNYAVPGFLAPRRDLTRAPSRVMGMPSGPLALVWKEWMTLWRTGMRLQLGLLALGIAAGVVMGIIARTSAGAVHAIMFEALFLIAVVSAFAGVRLGAELRCPVWWVAPSRLVVRLGLLSLVRALRYAIPVMVFVIIEQVIEAGSLWLILLLPLPGLLFMWMLQAFGFATYALLPASTDARAAQMIRTFGIMVGVGTIVFAGLIGLLLELPVVEFGFPLLVAVAELAGLLLFSAWRIQGNALAFVAEERQ
jgi:hypothetical protein